MIYLLLIESEEEKRKFVVLYEKYKYLMLKIALDIVKDYQESEDIVHEAFIKIAKNMHNIHEVDSNETKRYIIIITRSVAIDFYRRKKRSMENTLYLDEIRDYSTPVVVAENSLADVDVIMKALMKIPLKYRDVLILKYAYQYEAKKIAEILNITEANVRQRLVRGRRILEIELKRLEDK